MQQNENNILIYQKILMMFLAFVWADAQAVVIPAGTYYFDNSKVNYSTVKFVYGNDAENVTHILQLTKTEEGLWTFNIGKTVEGQTHYFFTNSALETGEHYEKVTTVKDLIVQRSEHRTQTFKDVDNVPMVVGATFVPNSSDLYTSGVWKKEGATAYSGTLPVMYINTENKAPITSKEV